MSRRDRFISRTALGYAVLASLWIFLSDYLLSALTNVGEVVWLSSAKGMMFIGWSTVLFYFAMHKVAHPGAIADSDSGSDVGPQSTQLAALPRITIYGFAAAASLLMLWVHYKLHTFQHHPLLMLFIPPIAMSALLGGLGPGLTATAIGAIGVSLLGIAPKGGFGLDNAYEQFRWVLLILSGTLISVLSEKLHSEQRKSAQHFERLSSSQKQLKTVSDNLPDGMVFQIAIDAGGSRFLYVSAGVQRLTGLSVQDVLLDGDRMVRQIVEDDLPRFKAARAAALHSLQTLDLTVRILKPNGMLSFVRLNAQPRKLAEERIVWDGIAVDVTEHERMQEALRKLNAELEQRVAERTAALTQANKSLESFSHIVAHDLRVPLRHLDGFVSLLKQDYADRLDHAGRNLLEKIGASRETMSDLIEGLLAVTHLERASLQLAAADLSGLATTTARALLESAPDRRVDFAIQPGLTAVVDKTLMKNVLDNLLGNAWKFTADQPQALIEFGATESHGKRVYFVRDNGAGFDPAEAENLFDLFHRVHSQSQFRGSGIGLASVKAIIANHGGSVWAEGAVGHGTTIYFTLPQSIQLRIVNQESA